MHVLILGHAAALPGRGIAVTSHRRDYERPSSEKLEVGRADAFKFARYQSLRAMSACFESVRSMNAFKPHEGEDGRLGHVCSTKLGGDWVLAESDQVAPPLHVASRS